RPPRAGRGGGLAPRRAGAGPRRPAARPVAGLPRGRPRRGGGPRRGVLVVAEVYPFVRRERLPWLARLAALGERRRVLLAPGACGHARLRLLRRAGVVVVPPGAADAEAAEAAAQGALPFLHSAVRPEDAAPGAVSYTEDDLDSLLDEHLADEPRRRARDG